VNTSTGTVFLSYAIEDSEAVGRIADKLKAAGIEVWLDNSELRSGDAWDRQIRKRISECRLFIPVISANTQVRDEGYFRREWGLAVDRTLGMAGEKPFLIPIVINDIPRTGASVPEKFFDIQWTRLLGGEVTPAFISRVGALLGGDTTAPVASRSGTPVALRQPNTVNRSRRKAMRSAGTTRVTISVLPFDNLSGDPNQAIFCEGFSQDIITELARWRLLEVRPRLASLKSHDGVTPIAQIARELNVRFLVEGSVRRLGDRIRITADLIDADTGQQIWGDRYDRGAAEIFAVQDEVAHRIVSTLMGRLRETDANRVRRKHPSSLEAYECCLRGNALPWDDPKRAEEAKRLFEKAIRIDPNYGIAYGLLANMRVKAWRRTGGAGISTDSLNEAYKLAWRAVELDDSDSTCHSLLGVVCLFRREFESALQHVGRAVELNPNNQWNLANMAYVLGYLGEAEQALSWSTRANQADPYFDPPWLWRQQARTYMILGRYQEALAMLTRIPRRAHYDFAYMAACHARLGNADCTRDFAAKCLESRPDFSIRSLMAVEPFKMSPDAESFAQSLRLAGLPE
jgi:TolB-like protein/tetratricopeptide (TPR) repeat protein